MVLRQKIFVYLPDLVLTQGDIGPNLHASIMGGTGLIRLASREGPLLFLRLNARDSMSMTVIEGPAGVTHRSTAPMSRAGMAWAMAWWGADVVRWFPPLV